MPLENAQYISELNPAWPVGTDGVNTSDDHHRNTKRATQQSFPNIGGEVTATQDDLNTLTGAATTGSTQGLNPVGTVIMGAWAAAPNGYLPCDGAAIDPTYTDLIALIGANTPNLEGQFVRGVSSDNSVDPDGPRAALSTQADEFEAHNHAFTAQQNIGGFTDDGSAPDQKSTSQSSTTSNRGGAETRPKNVALLYAIKW